MMFGLGSLLVSSSLLVGSALFAQKYPELVLDRIVFSETELRPEISGLWFWQSKALILSDKPEDHFIYELIFPRKGYFSTRPFIDFKKLKDPSGYLAKGRLDLEGISGCGDELYLVNERQREVLKITKDSLENLDIDFSLVKDVYEGDDNAGFEGLAVDCQKQILYVAKERDPSFIVEVDLSTRKASRKFELEGSGRLGQKVINSKTGESLIDVTKDVADLFFADGHLYILERNQWLIQKYDPASGKLVARVSYFFSEQNLYTTGEPFGLAEALYLNDKEIIIGLDQGASPLSVVAQEKFKQKGRRGSLLFFKRPGGF